MYFCEEYGGSVNVLMYIKQNILGSAKRNVSVVSVQHQRTLKIIMVNHQKAKPSTTGVGFCTFWD